MCMSVYVHVCKRERETLQRREKEGREEGRRESIPTPTHSPGVGEDASLVQRLCHVHGGVRAHAQEAGSALLQLDGVEGAGPRARGGARLALRHHGCIISYTYT